MINDKQMQKELLDTIGNYTQQELLDLFNIYVANVEVCILNGYNGLRVALNTPCTKEIVKKIVNILNRECKDINMYIFHYYITADRKTIFCCINDITVRNMSKDEIEKENQRPVIPIYDAYKEMATLYDEAYNDIVKNDSHKNVRNHINTEAAGRNRVKSDLGIKNVPDTTANKTHTTKRVRRG